MKDYLIQLTEYNVWANRKMEGFVIAAGEANSILPQQSSFPTIRETVIHIWDAQSIWLDRLHNIEITDWPGKTFSGTTAEAVAALVANSTTWVDFVHSLDVAVLGKSVWYKNIKGDEFSNTYVQIIAHVMNHGTYHRGKLVTMLRGTGFTSLASTDLIGFLRE